MSLDIAILGVDGSPQDQVSIGVGAHDRLMKLVDNTGLLARLRDYYADAQFEISELDSLGKEANSLLVLCRDDEQLVVFLRDVVRLVHLGMDEGQPLLAIAD